MPALCGPVRPDVMPERLPARAIQISAKKPADHPNERASLPAGSGTPANREEAGRERSRISVVRATSAEVLSQYLGPYLVTSCILGESMSMRTGGRKSSYEDPSPPCPFGVGEEAANEGLKFKGKMSAALDLSFVICHSSFPQESA